MRRPLEPDHLWTVISWRAPSCKTITVRDWSATDGSDSCGAGNCLTRVYFSR